MTKKKPPLSRIQKIIFAVVGAVLVLVITVGVITENQKESGTPGEVNTTETPSKSDPPDPVPSPAESDADASPLIDQDPNEGPTFGQSVTSTVRFSDGRSIPLEITVSPPTAFTPSDPDDATQAANIYFTVTIKNRAKTETFTADFVVSEAISGLGDAPPSSGEGTEGDWIVDLDAGIAGINGAPKIRPGRSITFKDGYSVASADDVTYKIQPAGMAGDTLYFRN